MPLRRWSFAFILAPAIVLYLWRIAAFAQTTEVWDAFFLDDLHGWVSVADPTPEILRTTDGGLTWTHLPSKNQMGRFKFVDAKTGLALSPESGGGTGVYRSDNGGETWTQVNIIRQEHLSLTDFTFASRDDVFVVGELPGANGWAGELVNGGRTLRPREDLPFHFRRPANMLGVFGDGKGNIWIVGKQLIFYSHDSGKTWEDQTANAVPPIDLGWPGASVSGGYAWLADPEDIYRTTDYGRNWTRVLKQRDPWINFSSFSFISQSNGCAVGNSSLIYCTHDGGLSWQGTKVFDRIPAGSPYQSRLFLFESLHGWALVNNELYRTVDGGRNFSKALPETAVDNNQPQALRTAINGPSELAFDGRSNALYIYELAENRVLKYDVAQRRVDVVFDQAEQPKVAQGAARSFAVGNPGELFTGDFSGHVAKYDMATRKYTLVSPSSGRNANNGVSGIVLDKNGNPIFSEPHAIFRWNLQSNQIESVSGPDAGLRFPMGLAMNQEGDLFIADYQNCRVRRIDHVSQAPSTVAGDGKCESRGDGGLATNASLTYTSAVAVDKVGNIFILEGNRIRRVDPDGIITTYAGNDQRGFGGDGGPANEAKLNNPSGIAVDLDGNLYIAEFVNNRIRFVDGKTQIITTVAGNGRPFRIDSLM